MADVRDAEDEEVAHFTEFIDKAYRLWLSKPVCSEGKEGGKGNEGGKGK